MSKGVVTVRTGSRTDTPELHVIPRAELRHVTIECPMAQFGSDRKPGSVYWVVNYTLVNQPPRGIAICDGDDSPAMEEQRKAHAHRLFDVISNSNQEYCDRSIDVTLTAAGNAEISFTGGRRL